MKPERIEPQRLQAMLIAAHKVCRQEDAENQAQIKAELDRLKLARIWRGCTEPWQD